MYERCLGWISQPPESRPRCNRYEVLPVYHMDYSHVSPSAALLPQPTRTMAKASATQRDHAMTSKRADLCHFPDLGFKRFDSVTYTLQTRKACSRCRSHTKFRAPETSTHAHTFGRAGITCLSGPLIASPSFPNPGLGASGAKSCCEPTRFFARLMHSARNPCLNAFGAKSYCGPTRI